MNRRSNPIRSSEVSVNRVAIVLYLKIDLGRPCSTNENIVRAAGKTTFYFQFQIPVFTGVQVQTIRKRHAQRTDVIRNDQRSLFSNGSVTFQEIIDRSTAPCRSFYFRVSRQSKETSGLDVSIVQEAFEHDSDLL